MGSALITMPSMFDNCSHKQVVNDGHSKNTCSLSEIRTRVFENVALIDNTAEAAASPEPPVPV